MKSQSSKKLKMLGLPIIQNLEDFSQLLHISKFTIYQLSANADKHYKLYDIPKKAGGYRLICQPNRKLKIIQSWILSNILEKLKVSDSCKGFQKKTSIVDNVQPHKDANCVMNIDLKDFFPSIKRKQVFFIFYSIGYNSFISNILSNICLYKDFLPQGSPCSPLLANLAVWDLDSRIQGFVGRRGITYTRYADDLTFSALNPQRLMNILPTIKLIIEDEKLEINNKKTRVSGAARCKKVTGLVIDNGSFGIGKVKYNKLRSLTFHLVKDTEQKVISRISEVQGWLSYLNVVDEKRCRDLIKFINSLKIKFPDTLVSQIKLPTASKNIPFTGPRL